jgi:serine/threonine protein kinase
MREVAQALHHAYWSTDMSGQRLSVVHRDVSPHNIILSYDGTVKLLDFGVAISAVTEHEEMMIVGKWRYMSPETTANQHIDHRSDLFSLGVVLYLLCSGHMPFAGREVKEIVRKIRAGEYRPLQEIVAVPERLAALVGRLLSPDPDDRPQYGQEVAAELTEIARQHGMESSGPRISQYLSQLFPSEDGGVPEQGPGKDIIRMVADDPGSLTTKEKSQGSVTPGSNSTSSRSHLPIDISETYKQRTGERPAVSLADVAEPVPLTLAPLTPSAPSSSSLLGASTGARPSRPRIPRTGSQPRAPVAAHPAIVLRSGGSGVAVKIAILIAILAAVAIAGYFGTYR